MINLQRSTVISVVFKTYPFHLYFVTDEPAEVLPPHHHSFHHGAVVDRCKGIEFDAVAVNELGVPYFFKGE